MDGQAVYRHAVARMTEASQEVLVRNSLAIDQLDLVATARVNREAGVAFQVPDAGR